MAEEVKKFDAAAFLQATDDLANQLGMLRELPAKQFEKALAGKESSMALASLNASIQQMATLFGSGRQRWIKHWLMVGHRGNLPTLHEKYNEVDGNVRGVCDATEMDIAHEIMMQSGIPTNNLYSPRDAIERLLAGALATIVNPLKFVNPDYDPKHE